MRKQSLNVKSVLRCGSLSHIRLVLADHPSIIRTRFFKFILAGLEIQSRGSSEIFPRESEVASVFVECLLKHDGLLLLLYARSMRCSDYSLKQCEYIGFVSIGHWYQLPRNIARTALNIPWTLAFVLPTANKVFI